MSNTLDTPQLRLEAFVKSVFRTKKKFTDYLKVHPTWVSSYTGKGASIIKDFKIIEKLSIKGFNYDWYLTGNGEMLLAPPVESMESQSIAKHEVRIADIELEILKLKAQNELIIELLKNK